MTEFIKLLIISFWDTLAEMSPYLLFGFLVAGILSALVSQSVVEKHLGGKGIWPILKASLFGVPLPLCSCGVIPVSMSLYKHGASRGSTVAFLLSTPQTGLDNIFITLSLLGPVFAIFTPFATFFTGIVGGVLVDIFDNTDSANVPIPKKCTDDCCGGGKRSHKLLKGLKHGFITLPADIGKPLFVGLAIAAIISVVVPDDFFADKLGTGIFAMLVMMALGIPVYVCASASVPMAAAMIMKGLSPGAALVFLMTGPATNAASFITIWKILGSRTAIIYLISVAGCALAAGLLLDYIGADIAAGAVSHVHRMIPAAVNQVCALVLLGVLAFALFKNKKSAE
jgi:hypothetical protein